MFNIAVALKIWASQWPNLKICINCDIMAVVEVMASGNTRDEILGAGLYNISFHVEDIVGKTNVIADRLSRYTFDNNLWDELVTHVQDPVGIPTHIDLICSMIYSFRFCLSYSPAHHQGL